MGLLSLFTAPKPFTNPHIATIQRNAISSWVHLGPEVEVLLVGDEAGIAETATQLGIRHLARVACNPTGTPLVSSIFDLARQASHNPLLAYANADMLLMPDLLETSRQIAALLKRFLVVGQRWDLEVRELLDFSPGWDQRLRQEVCRRGHRHLPAGSDFFVFPRQLFHQIPDFAIGRAGWDNWMIYHARQQGWPVVDVTLSIMAVHQEHDYSHLPGGQAHYNLEESRQNQALAGGANHLYMVLDSDKQFSQGKLHPPKMTLLRALRMAEVRLTPPDGRQRGGRWFLARRFRRLRRRITGSL